MHDYNCHTKTILNDTNCIKGTFSPKSFLDLWCCFATAQRLYSVKIWKWPLKIQYEKVRMIKTWHLITFRQIRHHAICNFVHVIFSTYIHAYIHVHTYILDIYIYVYVYIYDIYNAVQTSLFQTQTVKHRSKLELKIDTTYPTVKVKLWSVYLVSTFGK